MKKAKQKREEGALSSRTLKAELWNTLKGIKSGEVGVREANAVASQSREIMRVVKAQIDATKILGAIDIMDLDE